MARGKLGNPFAFTPLSVTIVCTVVYLAVATVLLIINHDVPKVPAVLPFDNVNVTEAWHDLQFLSNGFHPYNSLRNDIIHDWILRRTEEIVTANGASFVHETAGARQYSAPGTNVTIFNDLTSNLTFARPGISTYYEGTNVIVYIRGSEDEKGDWWTKRRFDGAQGVLVNAHYDSVPTGNGATDDGVGVVSLLQLIKHFSSEENQPKHGIIALFNNGEENYLNGARAFALHPTSKFPATFLNLEGAGAGGRALLFRSTDSQVTQKYRGTEHPFGTVITGDGFKRGLVRSQTDYVVFNGDIGMRGLDIAFFEPRARYHTIQDDSRHTSTNSIWHMLSAALHTMHGLTDETFTRDAGSDSVWFDLFGKSFAVFELHTLFAISVTLLVVSPVIIIAGFAFLSNANKLYPFSSVEVIDGQEIRLKGLRGFLRFPFLAAVPTAIVVGLALLIVKVNPYVVYSSPYAVWGMMLSAWLFVSWFLARTVDFVRPSALHRLYTSIWLFLIFWALLVFTTVLEDNMGIASGYIVVWYFLSIALATIVPLFELFALEKKSEFAQRQVEASTDHTQDETLPNKRTRSSGSRRQSSHDQAGDDEPTETTSLLSGQQRSTFANYSINSAEDTFIDEDADAPKPYEYEQDWSSNLPSWTWLLQVLLLVPFNLIAVGQVSLVMLSAVYQTLADGSDPLSVYLLLAISTTLLLLPLLPFLHRFTYHIPTFFLFIFIGTVIYSSVAFPFSITSPLKFYFVQRVDLETGVNRVGLNGIDAPFLADIVASLPSAADQAVEKAKSVRPDLWEYSWNGLAPLVVPGVDSQVPLEADYQDWLSFNASRLAPNKVQISVKGTSTRSCVIRFDQRISEAEVDESDYDERFPTQVDGGSKEIRLWSRGWDKTWTVTATWPSDDEQSERAPAELSGQVVCLWNEERSELIPALQEVRRYAPPWALVASLGDGLVEGSKAFTV